MTQDVVIDARSYRPQLPGQGAFMMDHFCAVTIAALLLVPGSLSAQSATPALAQVNGSLPSKEIRVTLLGTASGPRAFVAKAGISTIVEAGSERLLFDAARGFMQRLVQAGYSMNAVTKLFLTHLHS